MKYPARCNKRACQARRTLSKPVEEYVRRPKCHVPGCGGFMYIDKTRKRGAESDRGKICRDDCFIPPHRYGQKGCKHHDEFVLDRSMRETSKHSPIKSESEPPF